MAEPTRVAIVAFGMEHCKRGVEAHARMLFEKLKVESAIDPVLIKGSGIAEDNEVVLSVPKRHTWLNRFLGRLRGYNIYWEQVFFLFRLTLYLIKNASNFDYIYTQEYVHMVGMGKLKSIFNWSFKLVYCEGFVSRSYTRLKYADIIQEVNKENYEFISEHAVAKDIPHYLIPHFFDPIWEGIPRSSETLDEIRAFKGEDRLLLYVGPTELQEKNFVRLEEAVQQLGNGWKLLICGDVSQERLDKMNKSSICQTKGVYVSHEIMQRIYPLADLFVLPSIEEAFGIATIEAMGHGTPVLLHRSSHSMWLCNDEEQCIDMTNSGAISAFIESVEDWNKYMADKSVRNQSYFLETFTWERLRPDYLNLFVN